MTLSSKNLLTGFRIGRLCLAAFLFLGFFSMPAHAEWGIVDSFNLARFVPMILDAFMSVATGCYDFFVGRGTGIIYILIWGWLGVSMGLYLIKMYFPKTWLAFFGFKGGGEMWEKQPPGGMKIAENMLKPALRAIIAATILLQIKPIYVTDWIVDPFLRFGAIYTNSLTSSISGSNIITSNIECTPDIMAKGLVSKENCSIECPPDVVAKGWMSKESCNFLVQPVSDLSHANNQVIKRGFDFISKGLLGLMTLIPHGGEDFLNLVTGILIVAAFVSSNLFMALLVIQGIFNFGMALILYPFQVLMWVAKPKNPDKWVDIWPAFEGIIQALQQLIITMIACAFILVINIAVIKALFQWNSSVFVVAAGGAASSNVPTVANNAMGFGEHSILWLSAILTFYLMIRIFELTRQQLDKYTRSVKPSFGGNIDDLYKNVTKDAKTTWKNAQDWSKKMATAAGWIKDKKK